MLDSTHERRAVARREAADMLGIGLGTLDNLIATGALRTVKLSRRVLIPVDAVDELLAGGAGDAR
jgi:excisionase family DNA binding protein